MGYKKILVVSDNEHLLSFLIDFMGRTPALCQDRSFRFVCSPRNKTLAGQHIGEYVIEPLDVKLSYQEIIEHHDLVISAHCKQLFPEKLIAERKCVNIHPGFNPFNRGWYPQVFSIMNGLPLGATIHEIDAEIDHGLIIDQQEVPLHAWDTSLDAYERVQEAEEELITRSLGHILDADYTAAHPSQAGNLNLKKDFEVLREINLNEMVTYKQALDRLRALTHADFKNAYFYDPTSSKKVYVTIKLEPEDQP
ncbi:MAG TPA: dTDP-4-amino-4,6-dideoxyglucose formyltransferase [Candidatus Saccharimonadales bacterium]